MSLVLACCAHGCLKNDTLANTQVYVYKIGNTSKLVTVKVGTNTKNIKIFNNIYYIVVCMYIPHLLG